MMQGAQKPKAHTAGESIKHEACLGVFLPPLAWRQSGVKFLSKKTA